MAVIGPVASSQESPVAGRLDAMVLLLCTCLPVMASALIAPILARIQASFAEVPGVQMLVPLSLTVPSLVVALLAPFAGVIVDRLGRRRLLLSGLVLYSVAGTAPLWLQSLHAIVASRAALGFADAAIMTCCTTLIGDYFEGARRERLLAQQTMWAAVGATLFLFVGGALGESGWRTPFWLYGLGLVLLPFAALQLREPSAPRASAPAAAPLESFPWRSIGWICAVTLPTAIAFFLVPVHLSFLFEDLGETSTRRIGQAIGLGSMATVVGAALYSPLSRLGVARHLALAFALLGIGFLWLGIAQSYSAVVGAVLVNSLGAGVVLPTLVNWTMRQLSYEQRGRGTGTWTATWFLGQFICPIVVLAIGALAGGLRGAIGALGWTLIAMCATALLTGGLASRGSADKPPAH